MRNLKTDISELAYHLKQEKLFIESEKQHIKYLNEQVMKMIEKVYHASFLRSEQRRNYCDLILRPNLSPPSCCQRSNLLSQVQFIDAYQVLGHSESLFGKLLLNLRVNPRLCALCLAIGETFNQDAMQFVSSVLFSSVYASCVQPEDELYLLYLLKHLMEFQLTLSDNPRRLLYHGSCAFSQIFRTYIDTLPQAKIFLTAALHQPIMQLLMEDELFLDIDPAKAVIRFPLDERRNRFGEEGTQEYEDALTKYRSWIINKLVKITNRFIESIKEAMHCFPSTLSWLVRLLYELLMGSKKVEVQEISAMCIDLFFAFFLCSAIVTPEPQGIVDAPISHISRFNLIQVAQILQALAMNRWESPDPKLQDLYSHFDKEVMAEVIDLVLGQQITETPPLLSSGSCALIGLSRSSCAVADSHLYFLINFLEKVLENVPEEFAAAKEVELNHLQLLLRPLQNLVPNPLLLSSSISTPNKSSSNIQTSSESPKKNLINRVKSSTRKPCKTSSNLAPVADGSDDLATNPNRVSQSDSNANLMSQQSSSNEDEDGLNCAISLESKNVLIFAFPNTEGRTECPGMMPEDQVLSTIQVSKPSTTRVRMNLVEEDGGGVSGGEGTVEKRTRFSLSHDEGSIGNTSDNLEAISEAASNHSVASSMDDVEQVDQQDNLSDMVSANVSGRGTPNVSGRDTPSSQVTDGDDGGARGARPSNISVTTSKPPGRSDIEEKFGRFEIKPILGGDETISLVSDTWSTDVLASDSETIEAGAGELQEQFLDQHLKELDRMHRNAPGGDFLRGESAGETFETASEAWSTDVLASDSERFNEFDTDDAQSVARSDDTGRSEVEMELIGSDGHLAILESGACRSSSSRSPYERGKFCEELEDEESAPTDSQLEFASDCLVPDGAKYISVMKVNGNEIHTHSTIGFKPIHGLISDEEHSGHMNVSSEHQDSSEIQSLGRLSFTLSDLPSNGIVPVDKPLQLNHVLRHEGNVCPELEKTESEAKRQCTVLGCDNQRKVLSGSGSTEDNSIHLSTASLASSSSSGSEPMKEQHHLNGMIVSGCAPLVATSSMASTGAIPKSISFDKTAERGDKDTLEGDLKHKRGFFKGFKLPVFKGRRKVGGLSNRPEDFLGRMSLGPSEIGIRRSLSEDSRRPILEESTDDILAKYRKKAETSEACSNLISVTDSSSTGAAESTKSDDERLFIDISNIESSYAFKDAKRKLRMVLSSTGFSMSSTYLNYLDVSSRPNCENNVIMWLRAQLAEAHSLHDRSLMAQLHEAIRCLQLFDQQDRETLVNSLKEDYQNRSPYIAYLVRSHQGLLTTISHLEQLLLRLNADMMVITTSLVNECVRLFLEKKDGLLSEFTKNFTELTAPDEKVDLVESFLTNLYSHLERDPMWISSTSDQLNLAQESLERAIMSHIYIHALYPNGDGDVSRDKVLYEHIKKLSAIITPNHKDLRIPRLYQYECPWPSAQNELACLGAYKTSADKVQCVMRAAQTIMNLLSMAHETSVPAADDFIPVLVYVLIKANPPGLLSTIQYVNLFYEQRLQGESQYWWMQFCSSVEFIKTMDYAA